MRKETSRRTQSSPRHAYQTPPKTISPRTRSVTRGAAGTGSGSQVLRARMDAAAGLLEKAVEAPEPLANEPVRAPGRAPEVVDGRDHQRQQDQGDQRQAPVDPQHEGDDPDQAEDVEGDGHGAGGEHLLQDIDVGG